MTASLPAYALLPLPGEGPEDVVVGPDGVIYGGYAMVTGVCRAGRRMWCAGLQERALMRFDLPG